MLASKFFYICYTLVMRFFIGSIIFILGYFLTYASEPLLLSGIPLKTGYVFRGIGPEEAAKVVGGKTIEPFRIASGQFTPEEVEDFFKKSSPQKIASMFSLHQTGVDALDFPSNLPDNLITRMFDGTEEGFALQKQLLQPCHFG